MAYSSILFIQLFGTTTHSKRSAMLVAQIFHSADCYATVYLYNNSECHSLVSLRMTDVILLIVRLHQAKSCLRQCFHLINRF